MFLLLVKHENIFIKNGTIKSNGPDIMLYLKNNNEFPFLNASLQDKKRMFLAGCRRIEHTVSAMIINFLMADKH